MKDEKRKTGDALYPGEPGRSGVPELFGDARSILSIAISHNMDNIKEIEQADIDKYFGLDTNTHADASGSKKMEKVQGASEITYTYTRGGVTLKGTVNYATQKTTWEASGLGTNDNRKQAICEGLKVDWNSGTPSNLTFT